MRIARRVENLPPYLFAELDKRVAAKRAEGADIISLGVGDPDLPTPAHIVEALREAVLDPRTHQYPSYYGMPELRRAIADYYERRFGVSLDPDTEVLPLIGSKEGIAHIAVAFVDPGDRALVADPGYPVYGIGTILAGGEPVPLPLTAANRFLPDYGSVAVPPNTTIMWIGFPSNPTAAVAEGDALERTVAFGREHDLLVCHDAAYAEITFDGYVAPSILQVPGARDVVVEFGSLSKTYNMTGWRIGFAVGNAEAIRMLGVVKTNVDSGIFNVVQRAGIAALTGPQDHVDQMRAVYQKRRDLVVSGFADSGLQIEPPLGSIYVWLPTPAGKSSVAFAAELLDEAAVVVAPGTGYGEQGEGYVRISLSVPDDRLQEAMGRIRERLR